MLKATDLYKNSIPFWKGRCCVIGTAMDRNNWTLSMFYTECIDTSHKDSAIQESERKCKKPIRTESYNH